MPSTMPASPPALTPTLESYFLDQLPGIYRRPIGALRHPFLVPGAYSTTRCGTGTAFGWPMPS